MECLWHKLCLQITITHWLMQVSKGFLQNHYHGAGIRKEGGRTLAVQSSAHYEGHTGSPGSYSDLNVITQCYATHSKNSNEENQTILKEKQLKTFVLFSFWSFLFVSF